MEMHLCAEERENSGVGQKMGGPWADGTVVSVVVVVVVVY